MNLSEILKKIRKENSLSQEQLAEKLGVSRQAVSKWESNQAYPEMDKVIQITKIFNLNIDDLLNQDISEINSEKKSKNTINKYIDSFLSYITKTINMFTRMRLKNKIKCIIEQLIIITILTIFFLIIGSIGLYVLRELTSILPYTISSIIETLIKSIYLILGLVTSIILIVHIFKIRYLDYYIIIDEKQNNIDNNNTNYIDKKEEKIIIRDPKHSEYKFILGLLKCLLILIKIIVLIISIFFSLSLIIQAITLIISFLIIKTGLFFIGLFLTIVSSITINILILIILFNFIINKKNKAKRILITFITSLLVCGIGVGITLIGLTNFNYIDDINNEIYLQDELIIPMENDLKIYNITYYNNEHIEYIEEDIKDIKIIYKHTKDYKLEKEKYLNNIYLRIINTNNNIPSITKEILTDINNKKIINYSKNKIYIYTSKENIEKLISNK